MIKQTNDLSIFKIRDDNRKNGINEHHVNVIIGKITERNLLSINPILVNNNMEVLNGQHRLEAAKRLGIPIYYIIMNESNPKDIIHLNFSKSWESGDYLHFYCQNNYQEYIKLKEFIYKNRVTLKFALSVTQGKGIKKHQEFKDGKYIFPGDFPEKIIENMHLTIDLIKKLNGISASHFTSSLKFQEAILVVLKHDDLVFERWLYNLNMLCNRICPKMTTKENVSMLQEIYNFKLPENQRIYFKNER
jgi:hypothetical protein